jgi:uncharacterized protein (TIGR00730 family)
VCVFCASADGAGNEFRDAAAALGRALAEAGLGLVYGGAHVGLMGALADAVIAAGGETIGVIPKALEEREVAHRGLTKLYVVDTMHQRKQKMVDHADAFVALPGGFGTLDEFFEVVSWAQLGIHTKPCVLVDLDGYFRHLLAFLDTAVNEGFLKQDHREIIRLASAADDVIPLLQMLWREPEEAPRPAASVPKP